MFFFPFQASAAKGAPYYMGSTASLPRGAALLRTYSPAVGALPGDRLKTLPTGNQTDVSFTFMACGMFQVIRFHPEVLVHCLDNNCMVFYRMCVGLFGYVGLETLCFVIVPIPLLIIYPFSMLI